MSRTSRLRSALAPAAAAVAGTAVAVVAAVDDGARGALSALLGTALVVGFLGTGVVPLLLVRGRESSAALGAGLLLLNYTLRIAVAAMVLRVASRSDAVEPRWAGLAVIVCALAWAAGQAVAVLRSDHDHDHDHGPGSDHDPAGHGRPAQTG